MWGYVDPEHEGLTSEEARQWGFEAADATESASRERIVQMVDESNRQVWD